MTAFEGWEPDPFGHHEARYFVDGQPTKLVRDGSVEGFDDLPPRSTWPPHLQGEGATRPAPPTVEPTTQAPVDEGSPPGPAVTGAVVPSGPGPDGMFLGGAEAVPARRPRTRRVALLAALVVAVSAGTVVAVASGGKSAEAAVIDSVNSTMADNTAHVTMHMSLHSSASTVTGSGTGGIDFSQNAMALDMDVAETSQQVPIKAVYLGGTIYESIQGLDQVVPGKSWISIDLSSLTTSGQGSGALGTGNNPTAMLRLLALQGNKVTSLGPSTVDGVPVQAYSVKFNAATLQAQLARAHLPSWMATLVRKIDVRSASNTVDIDGSGHLRRDSVTLTETVPSAGKVSVDESTDFSDYGTPVSVSTPPSDQVVSFTQFLQDAEAAAAIPSP
jgi:hypothetical protein